MLNWLKALIGLSPAHQPVVLYLPTVRETIPQPATPPDPPRRRRRTG
jgi:hypothetical protein